MGILDDVVDGLIAPIVDALTPVVNAVVTDLTPYFSQVISDLLTVVQGIVADVLAPFIKELLMQFDYAAQIGAVAADLGTATLVSLVIFAMKEVIIVMQQEFAFLCQILPVGQLGEMFKTRVMTAYNATLANMQTFERTLSSTNVATVIASVNIKSEIGAMFSTLNSRVSYVIRNQFQASYSARMNALAYPNFSTHMNDQVQSMRSSYQQQLDNFPTAQVQSDQFSYLTTQFSQRSNANLKQSKDTALTLVQSKIARAPAADFTGFDAWKDRISQQITAKAHSAESMLSGMNIIEWISYIFIGLAVATFAVYLGAVLVKKRNA